MERNKMRNLKSVIALLVIFSMTLTGGLMIGCSEKSVDSKTAETDFMRSGVQNEVETDIGKVIDPQLRDQVSNIQEDLEEALSITAVQMAMARFEGEFTYAPEYSFVVSASLAAENSNDTIPAKVVTLTFAHDMAPLERVIYISWIVAPGIGNAVEVSEVAFNLPTGEDWEPIVYDDGSRIYIRTYVANAKKFVGERAAWSWKGWLKCSGEYAAGGCVTSAGLCLATGPGWAACTAKGCAASAVGGMAACAFRQLVS